MFKEIRLSLVLRIVAIVLGIIGSILIARLGGAEVKGVSSAFAAAANIGFAVINLDSAQTALRYGRATSDKRNSWNYLSRVWSFYSILILVGLVALLTSQAPLGWYLLGAVFFGLSQQAAVLNVGFRGAYISSLGVGIQQLTLIGGVIAFHAFSELDEFNIKLAILVSYTTPLLLYLPNLVERRRKLPTLKVRKVVTLMVSSVPWQLGRLFDMLLARLDILAVFTLVGAAQSGIYSVGVSTAMLVTLIPAQFAAQALHDISTKKRMQARSHSLAALVAGLISTVPFASLGYWIIELAYGSEFLPAYSVLLACLPGAVSYGVVQVQANYIRMLGTWKMYLYVTLSGAIAMIVGLYLAIIATHASLVGVGLAFSLGTTTCAVVGTILMKRNNIGKM